MIRSAGSAPSVEPLRQGALPLAFLVDYDGTIALTDVSDTVMAEHAPGDWEEMAAAYDAGRMGSRRLMEAQLALLPLQPGDVPATSADVDDLIRDTGFQPRTSIEEGIGRFVDWYREYYRV